MGNRLLRCTLLVALARSCDIDSYYADVDLTLTGAALRAALQDRISSPHDVVPYTSDATDTWDALYVLDADPSNADNVVGIYTRRSVAASLSGATDGWNREHLWPKSHGVGYSGADFSDLHHLVAADGSTNSARGNKIFGNCEGLPGCESPAYDEAADDTAADAESWRPPADVRGDIARAMFYMDVRYADLSLASCDFICDDPGISGNYSWLRRWHDDDPVDDAEQARSDLVCESYQLNRNPFVDYPELVARLFDDADETAARAAVCDSVCVEETDDESGASSLSAGGAMVAGVRTNPDAFAIVLLEDATGLEHLRVTDNGWSEGDGFRDSEGVLACTRAEAVAGTVLTEADFEAREGSFNLASGGDQLIVYNAAGSFVTALSINGAWDDAATSSGTSALPSELVDGETALALSAGDYDYAGSRYGAAAELREWLAAGGNWEAASGDVDATAFDVGDSESAAAPRPTATPAAAPTAVPAAAPTTAIPVLAPTAVPAVAPTTAIPVLAPTVPSSCVDSTSWYWKKAKKDCDYVAKKSKRCKSKYVDEHDVASAEACPVACGACDAACADSTSWYWKKAKKDCDYVAKKLKRCKGKYADEHDVASADACPVACGEC